MRDRWEHNCYLVGSSWGRGAGTNNSVAEKKLTLLLEHLLLAAGCLAMGQGTQLN